MTTGRVTVTGLGSGPQPVWYVTSANKGFVIGTDSSATEGSFEPQSGGPFSLPSFLLSYAGGTIQPVSTSVTNEVDSDHNTRARRNLSRDVRQQWIGPVSQ